MKDKIKGAIEVYFDVLGYPHKCILPNEKPQGLAFKHEDLEAYVQERERKAFEAARQTFLIDADSGLNYPCFETFEDFKKEQGDD